MPSQLASCDVKREDRVGVQIVAWTNVAVIVRRRIADAPVDQSKRGVERACDPRRPSARAPCVCAPRFGAGLTRRWYGLEAPAPLARRGIIRVEKPPNAVFAASDAHDDLAPDRQRRAR